MAFVTQVTENRETSIVLKVRELITLLTGSPPRNAGHIEELKYMLENFAHPNVDGVVYLQDYEDRSGTCPMNSDFWGKLADWRLLTQAQQTETKEFLLMKFGIDDLKLALDQYITQNGGDIPTTLEYRIFVNYWRGNKTKRRTQSLGQMMMELEQKEDEINQERDYNSVLLSQIGFVTHLNDGQSQNLQYLQQANETQLMDLQNLEQVNVTQLMDLQNLEQVNETQLMDLQNLEQVNETQLMDLQNLRQENETQVRDLQKIIEEQNERLRKYKIDDKYLRKQLATKDRINQDLHDQLKDVNMMCDKMKKQLQTLLQKK